MHCFNDSGLGVIGNIEILFSAALVSCRRKFSPITAILYSGSGFAIFSVLWLGKNHEKWIDALCDKPICYGN